MEIFLLFPFNECVVCSSLFLSPEIKVKSRLYLFLQLPDPESLDFERLGARLISTLALLDFDVSLPTPESVLSISKTLSRLSTEPELEISKETYEKKQL